MDGVARSLEMSQVAEEMVILPPVIVIMHFICNLTDRPVCILLSNEMVTVVVIVLINFWHGLLIISL